MTACTPLRLVSAVLLALVCALVGGCGLTQAKKDGEKLLSRHFQTLSTNGYDSAIADYGTQFFQKTTKDEWNNMLTKLSGKLGAYQSHSVTSWRVFKNAGTFGAGTTVSLQCQVIYSKYTATESFTLFKGLTDSEYKILGHQINSDGLLKE
jgi:hypothetical protein